MSLERVMRVRSKTIQTPIWDFRHNSTDSRISLVGMMHVGEQSYYDAVAEHVATTEDQGSVVHYELVKKPVNDGQAMLPEITADMASYLEDMRVPVDLVMQHFDVVKQIDALEYKPHWENHDTSTEELVAMLGPKGLEDMVESIRKIKKLNEENPELTGKVLKRAFRFLPLITWLGNFIEDDEQEKRQDAVIIHHRNNIAIKAVEERIAEEPDRGVTMLWGANHLPGIRQGLERSGYRRTGVQWLGAFSLAKARQ